jgi:choline-sulfatase
VLPIQFSTRSLLNILLTLVCVLFLCWSTAGFGQQSPTRANHSPDIFLITIDTLRADHVGCYGNAAIKTPALDALARDGIRFTNAFTPSPLTNTSHTSILTGLYPNSHGVSDFAVPLSPEHVTWATTLRKQGYTTAAFIGAVILDSKTLAPGLDQGFDFYDDFPDPAAGKSHWGKVERRGMEVITHAEKWLDKHSAGPRFAWIHLYDPHDPYEPPPPYSQLYARNPYDGEIAYADHALGTFISYLRHHRRYDNALVIVVGDHGEGLGQHKEETHGIFLYDSTLHVPLIFKLPANKLPAKAAGGVISSEVRTIDILPTVLDLVGAPAIVKIDGQSLKMLFNGRSGDRPLFAETDYPLHFGWAPLRAVRTQSSKLIEAPRPELYDLRKDPQEMHNLYEPWNVSVQNLRDLMRQHRSASPSAAKRRDIAPVNPSTIAELRALGYLGPEGSTAAPEPSLLPDPKDKIELQNLLHEAMLENEHGQTDKARATLNKLLAADPKDEAALAQLGELELKARNFRPAAISLERALQLKPTDSAVAYYLAQALVGKGDLPKAREALETSLRLVPGQLPARLLLGEVCLKMADANAAADQFEAALLIAPENSVAQIGLGRALLLQKKFHEAATQLEAASRHASPEVFELLSQAYAGMGKKDLATQSADRAARLRKKEGPPK